MKSLSWGSLDGPKPDKGSWAKKQAERQSSKSGEKKVLLRLVVVLSGYAPDEFWESAKVVLQHDNPDIILDLKETAEKIRKEFNLLGLNFSHSFHQ